MYKVRFGKDKRVYALKKISKRFIKSKNFEKHVESEKAVMEMCEHPFLMGLRGYFVDKKNVYFLTEFLSGGDLYRLMRSAGAFPLGVTW